MQADEIRQKCKETADGRYVCKLIAKPRVPDSKLQNIGYRVFLTEKLLDLTGTDRLSIINLADEKSVEINFVGSLDEISIVVKELSAAKQNAEISLVAPNHTPGTVERYSQRLMIEQLNKGIDAQFKVIEKLGTVDKKLDKLDKLDGIENVLKDIQGNGAMMRTELGKLNKLDKLDGIENVLKDIQGNGAMMRTELGKLNKLDKLDGIENVLKDIKQNGIKIRTS